MVFTIEDYIGCCLFEYLSFSGLCFRKFFDTDNMNAMHGRSRLIVTLLPSLTTEENDKIAMTLSPEDISLVNIANVF